MIQVWRIARLFWAMVTRTTYLHLKVARLPGSERPQYRAYRQMVGCRLLCRILGVSVQVEGEIPENGGLLVVSNHFGVLDPLVLATAFPVAFVGKAEIRKWPFLGWVASEHGLLFVERSRRTTAARFADTVGRRLEDRINVLVFPEGTTSPDESLLPFKTGAFEAVVGHPEGRILPVYLSVDSVEGRPAVGDARKKVVWSDPDLPFLRHCWELVGLRKLEMTIRFGDIVRVGEHSRKDLAHLARDVVESLRDRIRVPETAKLGPWLDGAETL